LNVNWVWPLHFDLLTVFFADYVFKPHVKLCEWDLFKRFEQGAQLHELARQAHLADSTAFEFVDFVIGANLCYSYILKALRSLPAARNPIFALWPVYTHLPYDSNALLQRFGVHDSEWLAVEKVLHQIDGVSFACIFGFC